MFDTLKKLFRSTPENLPNALTSVSTACPYCGVVQNPPPQRKKKCRDCGQPIYVEKHEDGHTYLLTEKEAQKLEGEARDQRFKVLSAQVRIALQAGDWEAARLAYSGQARLLFHEGRNHHSTAQEAQRCALRSMHEIGIKMVRVSTSQDKGVCSTCLALEGKVFSVKDALEQMPLPGQQCEDGKQQNPHGGWCRCLYTPVIRS